MEKLYQNPSIQIDYNRAEDILEILWTQPSSSDEFRAAGNFLSSIAPEKQFKKWLLNQEKMMIFPQDFFWAQQQLYPQLAELVDHSGKVAIVLSQNLFSSVFIKKTLLDTFPKGNYYVFYFPEPSSARAWLREVDYFRHDNAI